MQQSSEDGLVTDTNIAAQIVVGQFAGRIHCQVVGPFSVGEELLDVC